MGIRIIIHNFDVITKEAMLIREIPEHATFREKVQRLGWLDKLWVFSLCTYVIMPTLTTCSFQSILFSKNVNINKRYIEYFLSRDLTQ